MKISQDKSDNPLLAYRNEAFLDSDEARPIRILSEYLAPMQTFHKERIHETVVFFGSARLREDGPLGHYYQDARRLSRLITQWARTVPPDWQRLMVCTGGGGGIMEAANRGAADVGGRSIGLNIGLPHEQRPNPFLTKGLTFEFHYFFMRKLWFAHLARALVVFPGGFGTMDELWEMLTLAQTRKLDRDIVILLYGSSYWNEVINFEALVRHGVIAEKDLQLFRFVDNPEDALRVLKENIVVGTVAPAPDFAKSRISPESHDDAADDKGRPTGTI